MYFEVLYLWKSQKVSADTVEVSQPSRIINRVSQAVCNKFDQVIRFPSTREERQAVFEGFYGRTEFPGVIVCQPD
jgi:hypothetical protein